MSTSTKPPEYTLQWLETNAITLSYPHDKPMLENDRTKVQTSQFVGEGLICDWEKTTDKGITVQVYFSLTANWTNNHYLLTFYNWKEKEVLLLSYPSRTIYPPVWDRKFSFGPDYLDYIATQEKALQVCQIKDFGKFEMDMSKKGKGAHFLAQPIEEVRKLIAEGKSYQVISLDAESVETKLKRIK